MLEAGTRVRLFERLASNGTECARVVIADDGDAREYWVLSQSANERLPTLLAQSTQSGPPPPVSPDICEFLSKLKGTQLGVEKAWCAALKADEFRVLRMRQTETAFTGKYIDTFIEGTYACAACKSCIYASSHKFSSTCGWPSFCDNLPAALERIPGRNTEIVCAACRGHIGHVFSSPYHPPPKRERHCANSASLQFVPANESPKAASSELAVSVPQSDGIACDSIAGTARSSEEAAASVVLARGRLRVRAGVELGTPERGHIEAGTRLVVLQRATASSGTLRSRIALEPPSGLGPPPEALGWVSDLGKDARDNLLPVVGATSSPMGACEVVATGEGYGGVDGDALMELSA